MFADIHAHVIKLVNENNGPLVKGREAALKMLVAVLMVIRGNPLVQMSVTNQHKYTDGGWSGQLLNDKG